MTLDLGEGHTDSIRHVMRGHSGSEETVHRLDLQLIGRVIRQAQALQSLGRPVQARRMFLYSLLHCQTLGDSSGVAGCLESLAGLPEPAEHQWPLPADIRAPRSSPTLTITT